MPCIQRIDVTGIGIPQIHGIKPVRKHRHGNVIGVVPIIVLIQDRIRHLKRHDQEEHRPAKLYASRHIPHTAHIIQIRTPELPSIPQRHHQRRRDNASVHSHQFREAPLQQDKRNSCQLKQKKAHKPPADISHCGCPLQAIHMFYRYKAKNKWHWQY